MSLWTDPAPGVSTWVWSQALAWSHVPDPAACWPNPAWPLHAGSGCSDPRYHLCHGTVNKHAGPHHPACGALHRSRNLEAGQQQLTVPLLPCHQISGPMGALQARSYDYGCWKLSSTVGYFLPLLFYRLFSVENSVLLLRSQLLSN